MSFLSKNRIRAIQIYQDAYSYLTRVYNQSSNIFTPSSPFGQLLTVSANIGELIFYYIESAISELNIARARNIESIYGLSRLTGHNPTRGISAEGKLGLKIKTDGIAAITGNYVSINDKTRLSCTNNGFEYFIKLAGNDIKVDKTEVNVTYVKIFQGKFDFQTFTGTGNPLQSFSVIAGSPVDQYMVEVFVNGKQYKKVESIYDMNFNEEAVLVKTGISGGIDIYFGNNYFGKYPDSGAIITVEYVKTVGAAGNIAGIDQVNFKFIDTGSDEFGNPVTLSDVFDIEVSQAPSFGTNTENPDFTRLIAPRASKSFVLANPTAYIYFLQKYSYFSFIDAYNTKNDQYIDDDNIIYLTLIPDISKKLTSDLDYFNLPTDEFTLTEGEKIQVYDLIDRSGQMLITAENRIVDVELKKYSVNIVLRYFDNVDKRQIRAAIRSILNDYFINVKRRDRIPRSDLISLIEEIQGIDSVNLFFVSDENEKAIRNGYYLVEVTGYDPITQQQQIIETKKIVLATGEDPNLGLDGFGDIVIGQNELAIIRGGWEDRNGNYIEEYPDPDKMSSLNIYFKESAKADIYNMMQQEKLNQLRKNPSIKLANPESILSRTSQTKIENPINNIKGGTIR